MSREALYAGSYLGLMPILRAKFSEMDHIKDVPGGPLLGAGISAGIFATLATQPSDTIKTRMQAFPDRSTHPQYRSMFSTVSHLLKTDGFSSLYSGTLPRGFRIVGAVFILNGVKNTAVQHLEDSRSNSNQTMSG